MPIRLLTNIPRRSGIYFPPQEVAIDRSNEAGTEPARKLLSGYGDPNTKRGVDSSRVPAVRCSPCKGPFAHRGSGRDYGGGVRR